MENILHNELGVKITESSGKWKIPFFVIIFSLVTILLIIFRVYKRSKSHLLD